jgi:hypothetical protein
VVGGSVDGDLVLLHGLEEGGLGLGRRPVDLVGEDQVGEDAAGPELEGAGGPVVDADAGHVGGQEVGGELDAAPAAVEAGGHRLGQAGLAHPGDVLDEQVALGDQADEGELDGLVLALHDHGDVVHDGVEGLGERLDGAGRHPWCRRHGVRPRYLFPAVA